MWLGYVFIILVLIIVLIFFVTLGTFYYRQTFLCETNPDIVCWNDWKCINDSGNEVPWYGKINFAGQTVPVGVEDLYAKIATNCGMPDSTGLNTANCPCTYGSWYRAKNINYCHPSMNP